MSSGVRLKLTILAVVSGIFGIVFVGGGIGSIVTWKQNPEPLKISLADYLQTHPENRWLELTDCTIDYPHGVCYRRKPSGQLTEISVPVYPDGQPTGPVALVLSVPENSLDETSLTQVATHQTIGGMVRSGFLYTGFSNDLQSVATWKLADDYIILNQDQTPSLGFALGGIAFGLVALGSVSRTIYILCHPNAVVSMVNGRMKVSFPKPATDRPSAFVSNAAQDIGRANEYSPRTFHA